MRASKNRKDGGRAQGNQPHGSRHLDKGVVIAPVSSVDFLDSQYGGDQWKGEEVRSYVALRGCV